MCVWNTFGWDKCVGTNPWICSITVPIEAVIVYRVGRTEAGVKYFDSIKIYVVQELEELKEDQRKG